MRILSSVFVLPMMLITLQGNSSRRSLANSYAMNLPVKKTKDGVKNSIVLTRPGINKQADLRLRNAGLELPANFNPEGYALLADEQGVIVSANSAACFLLWRSDRSSAYLPGTSRRPDSWGKYKGLACLCAIAGSRMTGNRGPCPYPRLRQKSG